MCVALVSFVLRDGHAAARGLPQLHAPLEVRNSRRSICSVSWLFRWSIGCLGARQAERFSAGVAARHSQSARVHTDKYSIFFLE